MTTTEFQALRPGDVVVDTHHGWQVRKIYKISRVSGTRGQCCGMVRVGMTVTNLKQYGAKTIIFTSDHRGPERFEWFMGPLR